MKMDKEVYVCLFSTLTQTHNLPERRGVLRIR